ncbi:LRP2-binding protein-like isoform X2 [Patiria miniata]|nr:LRP2-binding protein-like isoform X2 [Patiria miniata]XP_038046559.1 LRP2-binding protein-like isoform X2 [Patiria miniata]XP_038046560.1 LRP2-binding protein-like isoform X2 [Patiria miniata]
MEHQLQKSLFPAEPLPRPNSEGSLKTRSLHIIDDEVAKEKEKQDLDNRVEQLLLNQIKDGDTNALFQLGQFYFEQGAYEEAAVYFKRSVDTCKDYQAMFQLGIMYYDGLGVKEDHKTGFGYLMKIASSGSKRAKHLIPFARFNVGRAYFEGYGVKQSDSEAEKWWLLAADDGNPRASIKAQTVLGMYYSRECSLDLKKAFFWHSEATGNGSLESQGALGVMYETGQGCQKNTDSAFECLKEGSERGNVYAMGNLVSHYYAKKLYTKAAELAARVSQLDSVEELSKETDCLPAFVAKGIALGCFYYARSLHLGHGVKKDKDLAQKYYSRAFEFDGAIAQRLQDRVTHGEI